MAGESNRFWSTLPGILTGVAAIITALTGAYVAWSTTRPPPAIEAATSRETREPVPPVDSDRRSLPAVQPERPATPVTPPATPAPAAVLPNRAPFPASGPLVDCAQFPTVNTVTSLMSWSRYYHQQVVAAEGIPARAAEPCNQAIDQRGMAHCKEPDNREVRQALLETLSLCRAAGIEWQDIRHSTISGRE